MVNPGARVMHVSSTDDVLRRIVMTGLLPGLALAFTGQLLMRISALKACFVEPQRRESVW